MLIMIRDNADIQVYQDTLIYDQVKQNILTLILILT